ncbi:hypothetical protein SESBI_40610 [Sesbania bispinosa]|nr:hypothetical protein SESBI_40610 [Sesbania bispinosa]
MASQTRNIENKRELENERGRAMQITWRDAAATGEIGKKTRETKNRAQQSYTSKIELSKKGGEGRCCSVERLEREERL